MSTETQTPRTDAFRKERLRITGTPTNDYLSEKEIDFARQLERELTACQQARETHIAEIERLRACINGFTLTNDAQVIHAQCLKVLSEEAGNTDWCAPEVAVLERELADEKQARDEAWQQQERIVAEWKREIERREKAEREGAEMRRGLDAVVALIDESFGVIGLHMNGDDAPWEDLRTGGRGEEWLADFDKAVSTTLGQGWASPEDVAKLKTEIDGLTGTVKILCDDWAEDDTAIKSICERNGVETTDTYGFVTATTCVERLEAKLLARIAQLEGALSTIAEYGYDTVDKIQTGICPYGCDTPRIASRALSPQPSPETKDQVKP